MRSDTVLFDELIPAGTTLALERVLPFRGRVKKMTVTNYPGQQRTLQVTPYMLRAPDLFVSLAKFAGSHKYFSGDDTNYVIEMSMPFGAQDKLAVDVKNTSTFPYDLYVLFEIEYE